MSQMGFGFAGETPTIPSVQELVQTAVITRLDYQFAKTIARLGSETETFVIAAAALASKALHEGHSCIDLAAPEAADFLKTDSGEAPFPWPGGATFIEHLQKSPLTQGVDAPLALSPTGKLYLRRLFDCESKVAAILQSMTPTLTAEAQTPITLAQASRFCVITGGPGTGKTTSVVDILVSLLREHPYTFRLLAPTGKAAARLSESVEHAVERLALEPELRAQIPTRAQTIHRALRAGPIFADVVVVDEASMVDLELMSGLLAAMEPQSRLILLGDENQLASVQAGSILKDIAIAEAQGPLRGAVLRLTKSHRFSDDSALGALARAIRDGHADEALEILKASDASVSLKDPRDLRAAVTRRATRGFKAFLKAKAPADRLASFGAFRILCAHKRGRRGVDRMNEWVQGRRSGQWYDGRPILITENDYRVGLYNGDIGVTQSSPEGLHVHFPGTTADHRVSAARLGPHESAFAMTVHRSQGSEFDSVLVVMPEKGSPVLSRELLYTAVTRARSEVAIFGSKDVIRAAIERQNVRHSGLVDRFSASD